MADDTSGQPPPDDQVTEAKQDIKAVQDIFSAGPDSPPPVSTPPVAPAGGATVTDKGMDPDAAEAARQAGLDAQIAELRARQTALQQQADDLQRQEFDAGNRGDVATAMQLQGQGAAPRQAADQLGRQIDALNAQRDAPPQLSKRGCSPAVMAVIVAAGLVGIIVGAIVLLEGGSSSKKTATGAAASSSCSSMRAHPDGFVLVDCAASAPLDGHWVLVDGLNQPGFDMGASCGTGCLSGRQVTVDKADATIDISGDKITGGTFKTGYSSTMGDQCTRFDSHVDATVSGGADQVNKYGQLIVDGTQTLTDSCDSNLQPVTTKSNFHTSRFYFLSAPDTLTLCYNIDPNTFNACTTVGLTTPPPSGVAATFKRG